MDKIYFLAKINHINQAFVKFQLYSSCFQARVAIVNNALRDGYTEKEIYAFDSEMHGEYETYYAPGNRDVAPMEYHIYPRQLDQPLGD